MSNANLADHLMALADLYTQLARRYLAVRRDFGSELGAEDHGFHVFMAQTTERMASHYAAKARETQA
jgi:hypothetical protein